MVTASVITYVHINNILYINIGKLSEDALKFIDGKILDDHPAGTFFAAGNNADFSAQLPGKALFQIQHIGGTDQTGLRQTRCRGPALAGQSFKPADAQPLMRRQSCQGKLPFTVLNTGQNFGVAGGNRPGSDQVLYVGG